MMTRTTVGCAPAPANCGRSSGAGAMKNGSVTPPSTCVSSRQPLSVRTLMITGGNMPGTLADARRTLRNSFLASWPPYSAIDPRSQTTGSPVAKSVVATSSSRPLAASVATASIIRSSA